MGSINWTELFPNQKSLIIFGVYIALFINQGILVTWSQKDRHYSYNTVMVVLLTEVLKLIICTVLYCQKNTLLQLIQETIKYKKVLLLYMVPAFLYCFYNNLAFVNLSVFDPTTYFLFLQLRVVVTGIIFQAVFKKQLSVKQWISLLLLTFGCMVKHIRMDLNGNLPGASMHVNINILFIFVQIICSCLAGVYNEYLLKEEGAKVNILAQNVFMYADSIICNLAFLIINDQPTTAFSNIGPSIFMDLKVILVMVNNATVGIVTSFFLKNLNSIIKTFASALELVFTAVLCWIFFEIPIHLNTVIAIVIVIYSIVLYSQNPVKNTASNPELLIEKNTERSSI